MLIMPQAQQYFLTILHTLGHLRVHPLPLLSPTPSPYPQFLQIICHSLCHPDYFSSNALYFLLPQLLVLLSVLMGKYRSPTYKRESYGPAAGKLISCVDVALVFIMLKPIHLIRSTGTSPQALGSSCPVWAYSCFKVDSAQLTLIWNKC